VVDALPGFDTDAAFNVTARKNCVQRGRGDVSFADQSPRRKRCEDGNGRDYPEVGTAQRFGIDVSVLMVPHYAMNAQRLKSFNVVCRCR